MSSEMTDKEKEISRQMSREIGAIFTKHVHPDMHGKDMLASTMLLTNMMVNRTVTLMASLVAYRLAEDDSAGLPEAYEMIDDICQSMKHAMIEEVFKCAKHVAKTSGGRVKIKL